MIAKRTLLLAGIAICLALSYLKVGRLERAASALAEARRISPDSPHVAEVAAMLEKAQKR